MQIGSRQIGLGAPCFIIAEAGVNHNGSVEMACELVEVAARCGADAVKFQAFRTEALVSEHAPKADYQKLTTGGNENQSAMLRRLELNETAFARIRRACDEHGVRFLCTPFDEDSASMLLRLGVEAFKVSSGDLTYLKLLRHLAATKLPTILSTGMADLSEVEQAVAQFATGQVALLHCVTQYPAPSGEINLRAIDTLQTAFGCPVGYSDHCEGNAIVLAAVARGAEIVEKHFTLDRQLEGPDHQASADPEQLEQLIRDIRSIEMSLGNGRKLPASCEKDTRTVARRSLATAVAVRQGTIVASDELMALRPATGLSPLLEPLICGRTWSRDVAAGQLIAWSDLE